MPDWHNHLTKEMIHQALQQTAGLVLPPTHIMQMHSTDGKVLSRPTGPPPGVIANPAGVLILLYDYQQELHLVLTRRPTQMRNHAGQISFPGGRADPQDLSLYGTALREAQEELDIDPKVPALWTPLETVYVAPSNHEVHPFVAYCDHRPDFRPNLSEVHEVVELPLRHLFLPEAVAIERRDLEGETVLVPHFRFRGHVIWGATAKMLDQLVTRIRAGREL